MKKRQLPQFLFGNDFCPKFGISVRNNQVRHMPSHQHDYYEFELIIEGDGIHSLNGKQHSVEEGDLIFVTPSDFHEFKKNSDLKTITIHFWGEDLQHRFAYLLNSLNATVIRKVPEDVVNDFMYIYHIYQSDTMMTEYKLKNTLEKIVITFIEQNSLKIEKKTKIGHPFNNAVGYINRNFTQNINLEIIGKRFGYAPDYFSKKFKKEIGMGFNEYITMKRLDYSKNLLEDGEKVIDAAYACGFSSERNFSRQFKKHFGITPKEFTLKTNLSAK